MKIAHTTPAKGELYAIERKAALRIVRALCPELPLLAFQTMHVPKMDSDIPYLATFSSGYIRLLSVRADFMNDDLRTLFTGEVFPFICNEATERRRNSYSWPAVIVAFQGMIQEVTCSDGGLFPSREEIIRRVKRNPRDICSCLIAANSEQVVAADWQPLHKHKPNRPAMTRRQD